ncbi:MAG: SBBP repeat-containing protein [Candidatus Lokiarchaeota archaeon]|nr:SBBP repeat-containing protein [Candidatus Lokiarchaeota archaeon]
MKLNQNKIARFFIIGFFLFAVMTSIDKQDLNTASDSRGHDILKSSEASSSLVQWNVTWASNSSEMAWDIALDSLENIYVAGSNMSNPDQIFIIKYDKEGNYISKITWETNQLEGDTGIALDGLNNLYFIAGTYDESSSDYNLTVVKYNSAGIYQWNATWGGTGYEVGKSIIIDSSNNVYVTGETSSFGALGSDMFVVKFNSLGEYQWHATFPGINSEVGNDIALDSSGNIYITGYSRNSSDYYDICVVSFDASGTCRWNQTWGISNNEQGRAIALDDSNNLYIVGLTNNSIDGDFNAFLVSFDSTGTYFWNDTWDSTYDDSATDVALGKDNNIYVLGATVDEIGTDIDVLLLCYDSETNYKWNATWGGPRQEMGMAMIQDSSGSFYITGFVDSNKTGAFEYDSFLIKMTFESTSDQSSVPGQGFIPGFDLPIISVVVTIMVISIVVIYINRKRNIKIR